MQNFQTPLLDGVWYVKEVTHNIDQGGYITELTCRRETSRNAVAANAKVLTAQPLQAQKPGATPTPVDSLLIVGTGVQQTGAKTKTKTGRNAHSTDGEFFTTVTRSNK